MNPVKTFFMTFSASSVDQPTRAHLKIHNHDINSISDGSCDCKQINKVDSLKYLGILLDKNLRWDDHIAFLNRKIRNLFYKFYQLRELLDQRLLNIVYSSIVESNLRYGVIVWGGAYKSILRRLEICQNLILKIAHKKPFTFSTVDLYKDCNVLSVRNLYVLGVINRMTKIESTDYQQNTYTTRSNEQKNMPVPYMPTSICQRFVTYYGPFLFNKLPKEIKKKSSSSKFANIVKKFLLQNQQLFIKYF